MNSSNKYIWKDDDKTASAPQKQRGHKQYKIDLTAYNIARQKEATSLAQSEPDDLIPPSVMRYFTVELSARQVRDVLAQELEGKRTEAAANETACLAPPIQEGSFAQTRELQPLAGSENARKNETCAGAFAEIKAEAPSNSMRQVHGGLAQTLEGKRTEAKAKETAYLAPAGQDGCFTQTMELPPLLGSEMVRKNETDAGIFVEIEAETPSKCTTGDAENTADAAMPTQWDLIRQPARRSYFRRGVLAAVVSAMLLLLASMLLLLFSVKLVTVHDENRNAFLITREADAERILEQADIALASNDLYSVEGGGLFYQVHIHRAYPVTVLCDGKFFTLEALDATAADLLIMAGIELGADDELSVPPDTVIEPNGVLQVYRVLYAEREVEEIVPSRAVEKLSPLVSPGNSVTVNPGGARDGEALVTYRDRYVDGELVESVEVGRNITLYPYDIVTLVGDPDAIMSPINGADYTDIPIVDNAPAEYISVIEGGVCTAYSFKPGVYGASGMRLFQGFVAVDPDEIPLGSLLYITSADGSFVYGWAIAADIGAAMVDGRVDVDLFFETYQESVYFGKHTMQIYVVAQLTQTELEEFIASPGMFYARIPAALN